MMGSGRTKIVYENMDALYAAMPDDTARAALVSVWFHGACGYDTRAADKLVRELAGVWGELVTDTRPDAALLARWKQDHGLGR